MVRKVVSAHKKTIRTQSDEFNFKSLLTMFVAVLIGIVIGFAVKFGFKELEVEQANKNKAVITQDLDSCMAEIDKTRRCAAASLMLADGKLEYNDQTLETKISRMMAEAALLLEQNKVDDAIQLYKKVIATEPCFPWPNLQIGDLLKKSNNVEGAKTEYEKALEKFAFLHSYQIKAKSTDMGYGYALTQLGKLAEAKTLFYDMLKRFPNAPTVYNGLGMVYMNEGNRDSAKIVLDKALQLDPEFYPARQNLENLEKTK